MGRTRGGAAPSRCWCPAQAEGRIRVAGPEFVGEGAESRPAVLGREPHIAGGARGAAENAPTCSGGGWGSSAIWLLPRCLASGTERGCGILCNGPLSLGR